MQSAANGSKEPRVPDAARGSNGGFQGASLTEVKIDISNKRLKLHGIFTLSENDGYHAMNRRFPYFALFAVFISTSTTCFGQDLEAVSRTDIAAANCPTEWAAIIALEPDLWADTNPIDIDPEFDQATTDAFNKYFLSIMAQADHVASIIGLGGTDTPTQSYFDRAEAKFDLSACLTMIPTERDLVVDTYHAARPSISKDEIRAALFEAFDEYDCSGLKQLSNQIFRLNIQDASFRMDYEEIMSAMLNQCG
jgi:hypothetical protein